MSKTVLFLFLSFFACNKIETKVTDDNLSKINQSDSSEVIRRKFENKPLNSDWRNKLIVDYIKNSDNELIKLHVKLDDRLEWLFDRNESNDSTQFYVYNIGLTVTEEDGSEPRF